MTDERRICTTDPAPWLPPGASAEVWAGRHCQVPDPVIVVRLLVVRRPPGGEAEFFCVRSPKGPNLPTRYLWAGSAPESASDGVSHLLREVFGRAGLATPCIGFIRNVVPVPDAGYAYPSPWAHVPVFLVADAAQPVVEGRWFNAEGGRNELAHQHWWPIAAHHLGGPREPVA